MKCLYIALRLFFIPIIYNIEACKKCRFCNVGITKSIDVFYFVNNSENNHINI